MEDSIRKRLRELTRSSDIQSLAAGYLLKDTDTAQLRKSVSLILQVMAELPKAPDADEVTSAWYLKWEQRREPFIHTLSRVRETMLRELTPPAQKSVMIVAMARSLSASATMLVLCLGKTYGTWFS